MPTLLWVSTSVVKQHQKLLVASGFAEIDTLTFSTAAYQKLQFVDKNEFVLNGVMYDIHKVVHQRDSDIVVVTALRDTQETHLVSLQTKDIKEPKDKQNNQKQRNKLTFPYWVWICQPLSDWHPAATLVDERHDVFEPMQSIAAITKPPPNPPPDKY